MKTLNRSSKGFTLVEIMIVVVIIGLLAAMAIPAFQKVRTSSLEKTVLNDARQIGSAAQQYMMENGVTRVTFTWTAPNKITSPVSAYLSQISPKIDRTGVGDVDSGVTDTFSLYLPGAFNSKTAVFDSEGKMTGTK
jgi:type IV pilus assembly protein PilA